MGVGTMMIGGFASLIRSTFVMLCVDSTGPIMGSRRRRRGPRRVRETEAINGTAERDREIDGLIPIDGKRH